jgi:cytidylate kinase
MQITITGKLGSGKSTICKLIAEKYGYEIFSTGAIQREVAKELDITPLELNLRMEQDHSLDDRLDSTVARLSRERKDDKLIFDSRMAWHFAEDVFKIFVTVDPMTAATRVMANPRPEEPYATVEDACAGLIERSRVEQARFLSLYGVDYYDFKNHNLVVDSTNRTPEEIVAIIWEAFEAYCSDPVANAHREYL